MKKGFIESIMAPKTYRDIKVRVCCVVAVTLLFPVACSNTTTASVSTEGTSIINEDQLASVLGETSGLYCDADKIYTVNDSGNTPEIFSLDESGNVVASSIVANKNNDWESITGDDDFFYVGDFGNNGGKRQNLSILKISKGDMTTHSQLAFTYDDYNVAENSYYAHDFDAEAMVASDDKIVLFSKSWRTGELRIYHVDKNASEQQRLVPVARIANMPGIVTGADWDEVNQRFVVLGYKRSGLGITDPFIGLISPDYTLMDSYILNGFGQTEGICVQGDNEVWITQENSPFSVAKLVKIKLPK
jgi:hypothetical protein